MNCPTCGGQTCVYDSQALEDCVKRRRKCLSCGGRFSTVEIDMDMYNAMRGTDLEPARQAILEALKKATRILEEVQPYGKD